MANKYIDSSLLDRAIIFAVKAHANTERRGKGFPYIVHPMEAVEIVATITADQELLAAAALHDTVEDTDTTVEEIRKEFGERIAKLVDAESDTFIAGVSDVDSWHMRKQAAIDRLTNASKDAKIVAMGDKLSNMRAIYRDYREIGDKLWDRFHAPNGKPDHEWHYRGLATALSTLAGTFAYREFASLIDLVFGAPKPELIDMNEYEQSGDGFTAISYNHKDGKRMMKLYSDFIPKEVPLNELQTSWHIQQLGLHVPAALRMVTDGKRIGVEFQRISPKKSFARAISNEPDKLAYYSEEFVKECKALHSTQCSITKFPDAKKKFRGIVEQSKSYNDEQKQKIFAFLDNIPEETTCIHGDLHIGNIITDGTQNYWIDLGDFAYGTPLIDVGCIYLMTTLEEELIMRLYHITKAQMLEFWSIFVEKYFDGITVEEANKMLAPYACLYMIMFDNRNVIDPYMIDFIKDTFKL